jgi:ankyrin repeat protein
VDDDRVLLDLFRAIGAGDAARLARLLEDDPGLATAALRAGATRANATDYFLDALGHHVYRGDTALHVAAAAYDAGLVERLVHLGASIAAINRRGAPPLHYAVDGGPGSPRWNPAAQRHAVEVLIALGADVSAVDKNGTAALHRAIRNRCASAVRALLDAGADPRAPNGTGSTPRQLASWTTGRGGSGSPAARDQQALILEYLAEDPTG